MPTMRHAQRAQRARHAQHARHARHARHAQRAQHARHAQHAQHGQHAQPTQRARRAWRRPGSPTTRLLTDSGSAAAEFVLVGTLLTVLVLTVMQLALVLHIRNTVLDAAAEGARFAALADSEPGDGETRTRQLISAAIGAGYAEDVTLARGRHLGHPSIAISVRTPLPLLGLLGLDRGMEVTGHAAIEKLG